MFTILILAVLSTIAVPSFRDASLGARLSSIANSLHGSIQIARSEAIKSNKTSTLCTSTDGATCATSGDWDQGWIVLDSANRVIHREPAQQTGFKVRQSGGPTSLLFQPIGVGASASTLTVCRLTPEGKQRRVVTVTATGVSYVTTTEVSGCPT